MHIINWPKTACFCFLLLVAGLTTSCVKVLDKNWDPQAYTVKKGDTLYSIAWRYEKDFRDIAKWNSIRAPFHIYPGQRLSMVAANASGTIDDQDKPTVEQVDQFDVPAVIVGSLEQEADIKPEPLNNSVAHTVVQRPESIVVRKGDTLYSIARYQNLSHKQLARWNFLSAPYAIYPGKILKLRPPATSHEMNARSSKSVSVSSRKQSSGRKTVVKSASVQKKALPAKVKKWQWPATGKLVKTFNAKDTNRKGIGIAGNRGQSIKAAAGGRVVYSGNGLIHYGNLVIIKHSNSFLSAYAHNRSLLVKEGDQVRAGQTIAQMGNIESGRARLHFEIRKSGKPVNPLRYLPKRKS